VKKCPVSLIIPSNYVNVIAKTKPNSDPNHPNSNSDHDLNLLWVLRVTINFPKLCSGTVW